MPGTPSSAAARTGHQPFPSPPRELRAPARKERGFIPGRFVLSGLHRRDSGEKEAHPPPAGIIHLKRDLGYCLTYKHD